MRATRQMSLVGFMQAGSTTVYSGSWGGRRSDPRPHHSVFAAARSTTRRRGLVSSAGAATVLALSGTTVCYRPDRRAGERSSPPVGRVDLHRGSRDRLARSYYKDQKARIAATGPIPQR